MQNIVHKENLMKPENRTFINFNGLPQKSKAKELPKQKEVQVTTMAIGEEGGKIEIEPPIFKKPEKEEPGVTTMALGEEGGTIEKKPIIDKPIFKLPDEEGSEVTTMALGEEGGNFNALS